MVINGEYHCGDPCTAFTPLTQQPLGSPGVAPTKTDHSDEVADDGINPVSALTAMACEYDPTRQKQK